MKKHRFVMGYFGKRAFHKIKDGPTWTLKFEKKNSYRNWAYPIYIYRLKAIHSDLFKELWL